MAILTTGAKKEDFNALFDTFDGDGEPTTFPPLEAASASRAHRTAARSELNTCPLAQHIRLFASLHTSRHTCACVQGLVQ